MHWIVQHPEIVVCPLCKGNINFKGDMNDCAPYTYVHICESCSEPVPLDYVQYPPLSGKFFPARENYISVTVYLDEFLTDIFENIWSKDHMKKGDKYFVVEHLPRELFDYVKKIYPVMRFEGGSDW